MSVILALALGCGNEKEADERNVSPVESPFPMDTSDTVITNPDLIPGNLYGSVEMTGTVPLFKGTCDSTFTLTGTPFTGYCPGCTMNFEVVSIETRDDGKNCPSAEDMTGFVSRSIMAYQFWDWTFAVYFQFSPYWLGGGFYGGAVNNDPALVWGVSYYPDPLVFPVAYEGGYFGTITSKTDTTIDWTMDWEYYDVYYGTGWQELHAVGHAYVVQ
jgi:hypothetical protein